jgi:hypothetical protein
LRGRSQTHINSDVCWMDVCSCQQDPWEGVLKLASTLMSIGWMSAAASRTLERGFSQTHLNSDVYWMDVCSCQQDPWEGFLKLTSTLMSVGWMSAAASRTLERAFSNSSVSRSICHRKWMISRALKTIKIKGSNVKVNVFSPQSTEPQLFGNVWSSLYYSVNLFSQLNTF